MRSPGVAPPGDDANDKCNLDMFIYTQKKYISMGLQPAILVVQLLGEKCLFLMLLVLLKIVEVVFAISFCLLIKVSGKVSSRYPKLLLSLSIAILLSLTVAGVLDQKEMEIIQSKRKWK